MLIGSACSVPLAPGYRIVKQSRDMRFVSGEKPELRLESRYTLKNSGTTDLSLIDVNLPDEKIYGRKNLHIEMDGRALPPVGLPEQYQYSSPNTQRIQLDAIWRRQESRDLAIGYSFILPAGSSSRITLGRDDFHLGSRGWTPVPQPPRHFLAPYPSRPERASYTVRVPSSFLVLARGVLAGRKQQGEETTYRFELRQGDLTPFVVAGKYISSSPESKAETAIFWTFHPLQENPQLSVQRITAAWSALEKDFGPLDKNIHAPHVVESSQPRVDLTDEQAPGAVAFPGGALVDSEALALGVNNEGFLEAVTHALAHNWFGDEVFFAPDAVLGMGEGLPEYATIVVEESEKGEVGRRQSIVQYLSRYDNYVSGANETPLGVTMLTDPLEPRRIALAEAALFFIALEDACGEVPMRNGLKEMVTLLRGQATSYDALRSTLEQSSGKNLAQLFRVWLNEKGIPADFRARYEAQEAPR